MGVFLKKTILSIVVPVVALFGLGSGYVLTDRLVAVQPAQAEEPKKEDKTSKTNRYENLELFQKVLHFVESNYVEKVDNTKLMHGAIKGMMQTLDPHSNFLPPEVFRDMKIDTSGKFGGVGIEIGVRNDVLTVVAPIEDTPAWKAGIQPGDRIVKINGESTKGLNLSEAVAKMRGKKGSNVVLGIYRKGFERTKDITIKREVIRIKAVKHSALQPGYGYVRLASFNEGASRDIGKAIRKLEKKGKLRGLVLDLRTNPGGLLDQAVEVTSLFLEDGVVVKTVGRDKDQMKVKHVKRGKARTDFPIAVLVNSSTASAAEIVAGALQDHKRAIVMGQPTFGKGSVQTVIELSENMGLKLTIERYYTPKGRSIQEKGVAPDILLDDYDPKLLAKARINQEETREKDLDGHISGEDLKEDFTPEELREMVGDVSKPKKGDAKMLAPIRFDPKKDYQVEQAVNYLKSYEIFQKQLAPVPPVGEMKKAESGV